MLTVGRPDYKEKEFCFKILPNPGSRKTLISAYFVPYTTTKQFVTNDHILVEYCDKPVKRAVLESNGMVVEQSAEVKQHLNQSRILGRSRLVEGSKNFVIEDSKN